MTDFAYNDAVFGDLHLFSMWDNDNQGILMKGFVENQEERQTFIDGYIFPTRDSLALSFDPDRLNIAFLRPFVKTVMTDLSGVGSGHIDFYGRFKALNVTGDVYALSQSRYRVPQHPLHPFRQHTPLAHPASGSTM